MNPLKQLVGQTAIYGLSSVIARILNFLLVPFYTRVFSDAAEYGVVNELYAYVAFFIIILTYGMETAYFRYASKSDNPNLVFSTSMISLLTTSVIFGVAVFILYPDLARIIGYENQKEFVLLLGLVLSIDAITAIPFARLRLQNKAVRFALIKLFNISANISFNLIFLLLFPWLTEKGYNNSIIDFLYDPDFRVGYVFLSNFLASLLTLLFFLKEILMTQFRFSGKLLKSMLQYSFPLLIAGFAGTINEVIDRIMLKYRLPDGIDALEQIGIYGANVKIAVLMALFIQMFRYASEPFFFSQEKNENSRELYASVLYYFTIFGVFVFLVITLYIDLFKHIIGSNYHEGIDIVPVILLGNLMLGIYFNLSVWYKLRELTIFGAFFAIGGALITLLINYFLIPYYGYMASAWGHLASYTFMVILSYLVGRHYYPVPYNLKMIFFYLATGTGIFLIASAIKIDSIFYRLTINTLFILIFTIIVLYRERRFVAGLLNIRLPHYLK
ncbi:MAG: oligosaccharide flippase family protein [Ignavibacteriaceae bacterium]